MEKHTKIDSPKLRRAENKSKFVTRTKLLRQMQSVLTNGVVRHLLQGQGHVLSTSDNLIAVSAGVKRQAGQGGNTAHVAPTFFSP
jgi:hypothetical protein